MIKNIKRSKINFEIISNCKNKNMISAINTRFSRAKTHELTAEQYSTFNNSQHL